MYFIKLYHYKSNVCSDLILQFLVPNDCSFLPLTFCLALKGQKRQSTYHLLLLGKVIRKINDCIEGLSELGQDDLCVWCAVERDVRPWATGPEVNRMYPVVHQAGLDKISRQEKCGKLVHTFVRCLSELKED